jgi:hypothetical protein
MAEIKIFDKSRFFRTYRAKLLGKCQASKARLSKLMKFLNPKPHLFNSFNLLLIPSTMPLYQFHKILLHLVSGIFVS